MLVDFDRCAKCGAGWMPWRRLERCMLPGCEGPIDRSEPSGNDLGAPQGAPVDPSASEGAEGSQILDPVSSPEHYRKFPIEVIEITERLGFCLGNVVKYTLRCDYKGKPLEDLKKARWYLDREIARREAEAPE